MAQFAICFEGTLLAVNHPPLRRTQKATPSRTTHVIDVWSEIEDGKLIPYIRPR